MNIIFIDIDGPLCVDFNSVKILIDKGPSEFYIPRQFDEKNCLSLNEILEKTNSKLVISSDWRYHYSFLQIKKIFKHFGINSELIIDFTSFKNGISNKIDVNKFTQKRADEIICWVNNFNPKNWIAIDDLPLGKYINNHIQVDGFFVSGAGQLKDKVDYIISLFNI